MYMESRSYVLFPTHSDGLALEKILKEKNIHYTIVPTPRSLSRCCGISIMINPNDVDRVQDLLNNNRTINYEGIHTIERKKKSLFDF